MPNTVTKHPSSYYTGLLEAGQPFVFTRWGDGEWEAILSQGVGKNCDGHLYYPAMCQELGALVRARPAYDLGLLKIARRHYENEIAEYVPGYVWVDGDVLLEDFLELRLGAFFKALKRRKGLYIGPRRLRPLKKVLNIQGWVETPLVNAWLEVDRIVHEATQQGVYAEVVGLSCGPAAKVIAHRLHEANSRLTILDFGSMFDALCGVETRSYHKGRDWRAIGRQL